MTSAEEQRALTSLAELLVRDLSKVDQAALVRGVKHAELVHDASHDWSGRLLALLYRQGASWPEISRLTGMTVSTAWRRAEPFM